MKAYSNRLLILSMGIVLLFSENILVLSWTAEWKLLEYFM